MSKYIAVSNSDFDLEFIEDVRNPPQNQQQPQPQLQPSGLPSPQISRPTIPPVPSPLKPPPPQLSEDYDSDVEFLDEIPRPKQAQQQKPPPSPPPRLQTPPITTQFASSHSITIIVQPLPQKQRTKNCENDSDKKNLEEPQTRSLVNDDSGDELEIDEAGIQTDPLANLLGTSGKGPIHTDGQNVLAAMNADKNEVEQSGSGNIEATNVNVGNLIDMAALYKILEASDQMSEEKTNDAVFPSTSKGTSQNGRNDTTGANIGDIADLMTTATCSNFSSCNQTSDSDSEVIEITDGTGKQSCVNVNSKLTILEKFVLTYPKEGDACPAKIRGEHMKTLRPNEEVNDEIIRFAFKHAMSLLDTELSKKIALVDPTFGGLAKAILKKEIEYLVYPYLHKNGDIRHWFLVIATGFHKIFQKPLLLKEDRVLHLPYTIAFLNSMPTIGQSSYEKIKEDIEGFFEKTCQEYQNISKVSVKHCGHEAIPELFGQHYGNDCGVYMVEYFKYFFSAEDVRACLQCSTPNVPKVRMEMELLGDLLRSRENVGKLLRKMLAKNIFDLIAQQNGKPFCDKLRKELEWDAIDFGPDPKNKHELLVKYQF